ncbi:MAG: hypothetical protein M3452_04800 [Chloroflexota bacterium]|nr:hypothetical protein [Chloroflexota bacterium]
MPWDYLLGPPFMEFSGGLPDLTLPLVIASGAFLLAQILLYNVQTRRLHRHFPLVNLQEWMLWTGLATFSVVLASWVFRFYFIFPLTALLVGIAAYLYIRFVRFPPLIEAYNQQLRRARFYSQQKHKHPEQTIRPKRSERSRRRRRR